jgi:GTP diphosphokinase / guanosine-3',5'-bis(diphosphate) 3'-diphosphatase
MIMVILEDWETQAYKFAEESYGDFRDDSNKIYFQSHIIPMVKAIKIFTDDKALIMATYFHDLIEDTDVTYEDLREKFGLKVANYVREVTQCGEKNNFPHLCTPEGVLLKLIDRASNMSRMDIWSDDRKLYYINKTRFWTSNEVNDA